MTFGALVTTYEAGMAVPDYPTSFGYGMFNLPAEQWVPAYGGRYDVFLEHGHRLLGTVVGLLAIVFVLVSWFLDGRRWLRWASLAVLALVIFQGLLGGFRVIQNERALAMVHGSVAAGFFALVVLMINTTSRLWAEGRAVPMRTTGIFRGLAMLTAGLIYVQIFFGAWLRHYVGSQPAMLHIWTPVVIALGVIGLTGLVLFGYRQKSALLRPTLALLLVTAIQILLGVWTWAAVFGLGGSSPQRQGWVEAVSTTTHLVTGAALLAISVTVAARSIRLITPAGQQQRSLTATPSSLNSAQLGAASDTA